MLIKPGTYRDPVSGEMKQFVIPDHRSGLRGIMVPPEGIDVPEDDLTWARRLRDGDMVPVDAAANETKAKQTPTAQPKAAAASQSAIENPDQKGA